MIKMALLNGGRSLRVLLTYLYGIAGILTCRGTTTDQDQNILPLTLKHILSIVDVGNWRLRFRLHLRYLYLFAFQVPP